MNKLFLALAAITALSCGDDKAEIKCMDEFSAGGLKVCSEGPLSAEEIEYTVRVVEEKTAERYSQVSNLKEKLKNHKVHIYFIDDPLSMECKELEHGIFRCEKHISGVNVNGDVIYVKYHKCLAYTSVGHEILHSIERYYLGDIPHGDHATPWLFEQADWEHYTETVEYKIFVEQFLNLDSCAEERAQYGYE